MSESNIEFKCAKCGSKLFEIPKNPKPKDVVTCAKCRGTAKYGDLQASALKLGKEAIEKSLRDIFKKAGFK